MKVTLDRDEHDRDVVYQLRYEVFTVEGGDERYADHTRRFFIDSDDGPQSRLVIAWNDTSEVLGTMRFTALKEHAFIAKECYGFEWLAKHLGLSMENLQSRVMRQDRVVIAACARRKGVVDELQRAGEQLATSKNCDILTGICPFGDERALSIWRKRGWLPQPSQADFNGYVGQILYKVL